MSVALMLVTSNQKLRVVIMSGERPAILVGKQEGRAGITTIVNMGSLFLFDGDIKAADLISYEAFSTQKTQDDDVKGFSCYHWGKL
ncbi:MAG: hypothetical protein M3M91_00210 [Thermoproteota archaeon]|nr:hypothetical protein [Thermoproteota archaeon]